MQGEKQDSWKDRIMAIGRPRAQIDTEQFEKLCGLQCTKEEICDWFSVSDKTLDNWCRDHYKDENDIPMTFSAVFAEKRSSGKISLRRMQWRLAEKNAAMAIFLGKNYLGQKDNPDFNVDETLRRLDDVLKQINGVENAVQ